MATLATIDIVFPYTKDLSVYNGNDAESDLTKPAISQLCVGAKNHLYLLTSLHRFVRDPFISGTITFRNLRNLNSVCETEVSYFATIVLIIF